jgi:hypothetical protein
MEPSVAAVCVVGNAIDVAEILKRVLTIGQIDKCAALSRRSRLLWRARLQSLAMNRN